MHPSKDILYAVSERLKGKKVVLGITGSIAAVECVKLIREIVRHGGEVHPVMSPKACEILGPYSVHFAAGIPPVTELTGAVEHVSLCGDVEDRADLLLIAPLTANTLGKMVHGIDDTPVTTMFTTAVGTGIPVVAVPAMHSTMYDHPAVKENMEKARSMGVRFVDPVISEGKAKMASVNKVVEEVMRTVLSGPMNGEKVLVVTGSTVENLDDMRVITNRASGRTGVQIAVECYRQGADVLLMSGGNVHDIPDHLEVREFGTTRDLYGQLELLTNEWGTPTTAFFPAAISDYAPVREEGKIPSGKDDLTMKLERNPKVIDRFRKLHPDTFLCGFKAESSVDDSELMRRAHSRLMEANMEMIVANDLREVGPDTNSVMLMTPEREVFKTKGKKSDIARFIIEKSIELRSREDS